MHFYCSAVALHRGVPFRKDSMYLQLRIGCAEKLICTGNTETTYYAREGAKKENTAEFSGLRDPLRTIRHIPLPRLSYLPDNSFYFIFS